MKENLQTFIGAAAGTSPMRNHACSKVRNMDVENIQNSRLDVFISYSSKNKAIADAVVADFEQHGIKCWYAPRDITPGEDWVPAIKTGIYSAKVFVLIFTEDSNASRQVMNEVAMAFKAEKTIIPFKLSSEELSDELEYYLTRVHWLDAVSQPFSKHIDELRSYVKNILDHPGEASSNLVSHEQKSNVNTNARNTDLRKADIVNGADPSESKKKNINKKLIIGISIGAIAVITVIILVIIKLGGSKENNPKDNNQLKVTADTDKNDADVEKSKNNTDNTDKQATENNGNNETVKDNQITDVPKEDDTSAEELMAQGFQALFFGLDCKDDYIKARNHYEKAAEKGEAEAYYYLGLIYENEYDYKSALKEFEKGISLGSNLSLLAKGKLLQNGLCGEANINKAWELYNQAKENGCIEADWYRALIILYGFAGQESNAEKAVELYKNVAEQSDRPEFKAIAYKDLGSIYKKGLLGIPKDYEKSIEYLNKAYEVLNSDDCKINIECIKGSIYEDMGETVKAEDCYRISLKLSKEMAEAGSISNMVNCGLYYFTGKGTEADYQEAIKWFRAADDAVKAINKDNCCENALSMLGIMYHSGLGFEKDNDKAYECFKEASDKGYGDSANYIGRMYYEGSIGQDEEGNINYNLAKQWFDKAIEHGCIDAYSNLGTAYLEGKGVDPDEDKGLGYLKKGAECGSSACISSLVNYYFIKDMYTEAFQWAQIAGSLEEDSIYYKLGLMYFFGLGTEADVDEAVIWWTKAARAGDVSSILELINGYYFGNFSVGEKHEKAFEWAQKGALLGSPECMYALSALYLKGQGCEKDLAKAEKWLKTASEAGLADAMFEYGQLKLSGYETIQQDVDEGIKLLKNAGEKGITEAYEELVLYYQGEENFDAAYDLLNSAHESGHNLNSYSLYLLSSYCYKGYGTTEDKEKAFKIMQESAIKGEFVESFYVLGAFYQNGIGTDRDCYEALYWYGKALDSDSILLEDKNVLRAEIKKMYDEGQISKEDAAKWIDLE